MKKLTALLSFLILFTAFTCEDEPLDSDIIIPDGSNPNGLIGNWKLVSFDIETTTETDASGTPTETTTVLESTSVDYNLEFLESNFTTSGGYNYTVDVTMNGENLLSDIYMMENISGSGAYSVEGNEMTVNGQMFEFTIDGIDDSAFNLDEQTLEFELTNNGNTLTFYQDDTQVDTSSGFQVTVTNVSTSIWQRVGDAQSSDCEQATTAASQAEAAYNVDTTNTDLCNAYKTALQDKIAACGDANGSIQAIIDGLDCNSSTDLVLLKKVVATYGDGSTETEIYSYDGNKLTSIDYGDGEMDTFTYEAGLLVRYDEVLEDSEGNLDSDYALLEYDSQNRLILETYYNEPDVASQKWTYGYNSNGTVSVVGYTIDQSGNETVVEDYAITITNGNYVHDEGEGYSTDYTFDDKNGVLKNIHAIDTFVLLGYIDGINNLMSASVYYNGVLDESESSSITYTYNTDDYPITATFDYGGTIDDFTAELFYE